MDHIVVTGVDPYDGRYEFDLDGAGEPTTLEWGWIKRYAGYLPLTIGDGYRGADPELFTVFALIAMYRAGRIDDADIPDVIDRLRRVPFGSSIRMEGGQREEEEDAGPPAGSSSVNGSASGDGSTTSSDRSAIVPPATGIPALATSGSGPATSPG